jgi:hypothetical protein
MSSHGPCQSFEMSLPLVHNLQLLCIICKVSVSQNLALRASVSHSKSEGRSELQAKAQQVAY